MSKVESVKSMIGGQVVLRNGKTYKIVGETNAYWICKETRFLKNNQSIEKIMPPKKKAAEKSEALESSTDDRKE